jgi:hypothetical protein
VQAHLAFGFVTAQHTNIRHYRITWLLILIKISVL